MKQSMVSHSAVEAKYQALAHTISDLVWLRFILCDTTIHVKQPIPFYCDNISAIKISHKDVLYERTKHIEIDCHFVRKHVKFRTKDLKSILSADQLVEFFTKSHCIQRFGNYGSISRCCQ